MTSLPVLRRAAAAVGVFHLVATGVALAAGSSVRAVLAVAFVVLFLVGSVIFMVGFVIAAGRSREESVSVAGAFFLGDGAVSGRDRRWFGGWLLLSVVVGVGGASLAPFTAVAFTVLVPMFGIGLAALVGSRHGVFDEESGGTDK